MGEIVNLRQARKQRDRSAARQAAQEARVRHGRSKGERRREETEAAQAKAMLDGAQLNCAPRDPQ